MTQELWLQRTHELQRLTAEREAAAAAAAKAAKAAKEKAKTPSSSSVYYTRDEWGVFNVTVPS